MQKHLQDQTWAPHFVKCVYALRTCPSALLFHTAMEQIITSLQQSHPSEISRACALQTHCLTTVAPARFQLQHVDFNLISADWWCGLGRLQPGSASGSQSQESWHRHKLKKYMPDKYQKLPAFTSSLSSFTSSRLKKLAEQLPDVPVERFPDTFVLHDSQALTKEGRASASQYHRTAAFDKFVDDRHQNELLLLILKCPGQRHNWPRN